MPLKLLTLLFALFWFLSQATVVGAQNSTGGPSVSGLLTDRYTDKRLSGVAITIQSDNFTKTVRSAADGSWLVELPNIGKFKATLDLSTLPEGIRVERGDAEITFVVELNRWRPKYVNWPLTSQIEGDESVKDMGQERQRPPSLEMLRVWSRLMPSLLIGAVGLPLVALISLVGWYLGRNAESYARKREERDKRRYVLRKGRH